MKNKVILISIDGMRPDGFLACGHPFIRSMMACGAYTLCASSMRPSVTLPCHMSIFHSIPPQRHGTTTNLYMPPVHAVKGLFEQIHDAGGHCAMFYGWEPIRDVARPGSLARAEYVWSYARESVDQELTARTLACIREDVPDFIFLYLVDTDEKGGHDNGWMTEAYLSRINTAIGCVQAVYDQAGEDYTIIVTADHGGHDRTHGTDLPEDMTIPMFFIGPDFAPGTQLENVSLLDIAPTVADVMGVYPANGWEGRSLAK
ncbi:MAG: alkaline phosphatase family protein [Clostridia bacterium]|nr:alkaline phosphatase family protein [Clostridia bacterium]